MDRKHLLAISALVSWCTFLGAVGEILADLRAERERQRQELAAAAQAGAIAATIINAVVDDDLEAADCTDVLALCPDPTRHEHSVGAD